MDGYYSHHPTVQLTRPLALVGFLGSEVAQVGYALASQTGLPFVEVDRQVEHAAGATRSRIALDQGMAALRALERAALARALVDRPPAILVLNDASLIDRAVRGRVVSETILIYVRRPRAQLLARLQARLAAAPGSLPEFLQGPPRSEADLEPLLRAREGGYEAAWRVVEAGKLHPQAIARRIMDLLGWGSP